MGRAVGRHRRQAERGQTIVLVAISLVSLLAMAALAIDVVTLYVARTEIQRAADAAALAGAKAIADSGVTTLQVSPTPDPNLGPAQALATNMAQAAINAVLTTNLVAGSPPTWTNSPPAITYYPTSGGLVNNPQIIVILQQANLPTFFARIFGKTAASVTASATAEAYNPSNMQNFTPIAPKCVKPWLVSNYDSSRSPANPPFIDPTTGLVETGVIGEQIVITANCDPTTTTSCSLGTNPPQGSGPETFYVPALVTPPTGSTNFCPACLGATAYENSIECCDNLTTYTCGGGFTNAQWDPTVYPAGASGPTQSGVQCLIHAGGPGLGQGQDSLAEPITWPSAPMRILAGSGPSAGNPVSTSSSIVTIPIIESDHLIPVTAPGNVYIIGFMQAFITGASNGDVSLYVLNIAACSSSTPTAPAIVGGSGTSPVPVRLISPP